jgi:glycosyltransferase involved in cell wall biosynthesis
VIGDAGFVTSEGDADALGQALARLRDDTDLRADLGRRGRERVLERYTHARIAEQTVQVYRQVMAGR